MQQQRTTFLCAFALMQRAEALGAPCLGLGWQNCGGSLLKLSHRVARQHLKGHTGVVEVQQQRPFPLPEQRLGEICCVSQPGGILQGFIPLLGALCLQGKDLFMRTLQFSNNRMKRSALQSSEIGEGACCS